MTTIECGAQESDLELLKTPAEYRSIANDARAGARRALDVPERVRFLRLADDYEHLASVVEYIVDSDCKIAKMNDHSH